MKKFIIVLSLFLAGKVSQAQEFKHIIGLQAAGFAREGVIKETSPAAGIFYNYSINTRLGIEIAALYRKQYAENYWSGVNNDVSPDLPMAKFRLNRLEIPVNVKLNLNKADAKGWRTDLLVGGTYSYFLHTIIRDIHTNEKLFKYGRMRNLADVYYANLGFELKHKVGANYMFAFNPGIRVSLSDNFSESFIYLQLKFGRNL